MTKISKIEIRYHTKASEKYVDVLFVYENSPQYLTSIPIEYRRTGTEIEEEDIDRYLSEVYEKVRPSGWATWRLEQSKFWNEKPGAEITRAFFEVLAKDFIWCCVTCTLPKNPNWARRIQDIKEFGYTLATHTKRRCNKCQKNTTQLMLVPLQRGGITGYESWTALLRNRIVRVLESFDAYEAKKTRKEGLLPDHKFPEIRWDSKTKRTSLENLTDEELKRDFQLLSNQRNQQKREVCRNCSQSGERGSIYGLNFFYQGTKHWDKSVPKTGKAAEAGCIGCGWYDISKWREEINKRLKE